MKVQCDVCSRDKASVFCCADEAALCDTCDRSVHHANKLAGKHRRFSLSSSPQSHPLCDICQEKRGFVFCQQDRAILCHDCDAPIHTANELTMKHSRFLITGVRLSSEPMPDADDSKGETVVSSTTATAAAAAAASADSSSISEYLMKTLPGYCVEDLLLDDAAVAAKDAFYKSNELVPYFDADLNWDVGFSPGVEELLIHVPCMPQTPQPNTFCRGSIVGSVSVHNYEHGSGVKEMAEGAHQSYGVKMGRERWSGDDSLMVPQINSNMVSINSKRHRTSSAWDF